MHVTIEILTCPFTIIKNKDGEIPQTMLLLVLREQKVDKVLDKPCRDLTGLSMGSPLLKCWMKQ